MAESTEQSSLLILRVNRYKPDCKVAFRQCPVYFLRRSQNKNESIHDMVAVFMIKTQYSKSN
jgi:hypothetical protein